MTAIEPHSRLVDAISAGDVQAAQGALADGADANAICVGICEGTPLLVLAAEKGELAIVRLLLDHGANLLAQGWRDRQSMIHDDDWYRQETGDAMQRAIARNCYDVVEHLLERGASADAALGAALGNERIARLLLERGAHPTGQHLASCVTHGSLPKGNLEGIRLLLEFGAAPNSFGCGKRPVILDAIEYGRLEEARALLAAGATMPSHADVELAVADAWMRGEPEFRARSLATARALGFDIDR
jgi:ankyrin repeat protein